MKVLSLFDGISCAYEGCLRAGIDVKEYYACEIDKNAIKVSQARHPDIIRPVNDVRFLSKLMLPEIDLLIGGSPCQDLSIAKKDRKGLSGDRSGLFWEYVRILKEVKPKYFVLENVASMPKADKDIITAEMGVEPVMFNASLVSAQMRKRLFWTNIKFELPADRGIVLKDILEEKVDDSYFVNHIFNKTAQTGRNSTKKLGYVGDKDHQAKRVYDDSGKLPALNVVCNSMVKVGFVGDGEQYGQGGQAHRVYSEEGKSPTLSSFSPLIKLGHIGNSDSQANRVYSPDGKSPTLSANGGGLGAKTGLYDIEGKIRKLTPTECERLQGLPDDYTAGISKTQRYKCLGNAFNVDVISVILSSADHGHRS
jgi:DNA (cytosine-5)-methyltransferase 3A